MSLQRQEKLLKQIEREENDLAKMVGSGQYFLFFVFFFWVLVSFLHLHVVLFSVRFGWPSVFVVN